MNEDDSTGPSVTPTPPPRAGGPAPWLFVAIGLILVFGVVATAAAALIFLRT